MEQKIKEENVEDNFFFLLTVEKHLQSNHYKNVFSEIRRTKYVYFPVFRGVLQRFSGKNVRCWPISSYVIQPRDSSPDPPRYAECISKVSLEYL